MSPFEGLAFLTSAIRPAEWPRAFLSSSAAKKPRAQKRREYEPELNFRNRCLGRGNFFALVGFYLLRMSAMAFTHSRR